MPDSTPADAPALRRLWNYASEYRPQIVLASVYSFLNKAVDLAPPFLIGMAVDVVANGSDSFLGNLGIEDPKAQILVIAVATFVIWGLESLFEYLLGVEWRNLAHPLRVRVEAASGLSRRSRRPRKARVDGGRSGRG